MSMTRFELAFAANLLIHSADEHFEEIEVKPLPDKYSFMKEVAEFKGCYNNAYNFVSDNPTSVSYVCAVGVHYIPIDHAIIEVNGEYYDPTWEAHSSIEGARYFLVRKFELRELIKFIAGNDMRPPSCGDVLLDEFLTGKREVPEALEKQIKRLFGGKFVI